MSIDNQVGINEENRLWTGLYKNRITSLNDLAENYMALPINARSHALYQLDQIMGFLRDGTYWTDGGMAGEKFRGPSRTAYHYFAQIREKSIVDEIVQILQGADKNQIRKVYGKMSTGDVAKRVVYDTGVGKSSALSYVMKFKHGKKCSGYMADKVAHWVVDHGYRADTPKSQG